MIQMPASGRGGRTSRRTSVAAILVLVLATLPVGILPSTGQHDSPGYAAAQAEPVPSGDVIVVLKDRHADPRAEARAEGISPRRVYTRALTAFAATLTPDQAARLARSPRVASISPDLPVAIAAQTVPTGVARIGGTTNPIAHIDGVDERVDADVAILDTGIADDTGDLNVAGGVDCDGTDTGVWQDENGHGTHVAGIIGALDNNQGVVGVAPGARLWSVRVLGDTGSGSTSALLCGLDWVVGRVQTGHPIDVVNMSLTGTGADGECASSALHEAICTVVAAGVTVVAAAGNGGRDAATTTPATYDQVIAVSAFNDFDGQPGGLGTKPASCSTSSTVDDAFATYSNYGADVDIAAPGTCIASLALGGGLAYRTGTSMAAPHVTGAVALFKSVNHGASPASVRSWLLGPASQPQNSDVGFSGGISGEPVLAIGNLSIAKEPYQFVGSRSSANSRPSTLIWDGNEATIWKTNVSTPPNSAYVWVDLGASKPITTVRWVFGQANLADSMRIQTSNDAAQWTTRAYGGNAPVGNWQGVSVDVSARYVRFVFFNIRNRPQLGGLAEVQVLPPGASSSDSTPSPTPTMTPTTAPTNTPVSTGAYPIVDSYGSANARPSTLAWDGDESTIWKTNVSSPPNSAYLWIDLGSIVSVGEVRWVFGQANLADSMRIQTSNDAAQWTTRAYGGNAPVGNWQGVSVDVSARYVRFVFFNIRNRPQLGGLAEVQVLPPGASSLSAATEPTATSTASATATASPTGTPTSTSTETPTSPPASSPSPMTTSTPTPSPPSSEVPISSPTVESTAEPTAAPTETPTETATATPSETPTAEPSATPTDEATIEPESNSSGVNAGSPTAGAPSAESSNFQPYRVVRTIGTGRSESGTVLVDGDPTTYWLADVNNSSDTASVTLDLGEAKQIGSIRWLFAVGGLADGMKIEVARGRRDWSTLSEPGNAEPGEWQEFTPEEPVVARYVRFTFDNPGGDDQVGGLAEVEIGP